MTNYFVGRVENMTTNAVTYFIFFHDKARAMYRVDFGPFYTNDEAETALSRITEQEATR